jgi:hypothetical protein
VNSNYTSADLFSQRSLRIDETTTFASLTISGCSSPLVFVFSFFVGIPPGAPHNADPKLALAKRL